MPIGIRLKFFAAFAFVIGLATLLPALDCEVRAEQIACASGSTAATAGPCATAVVQFANGSSQAQTVTAAAPLPVQVQPTRCTLTNRSASVTTGGTAVTIATNATRNYIFIQNPATLAQQFASGGTLESLWIDPSGTAAVNGASSIEIGPGASYVMEASTVTTQAISINAATSLHRFVAKEC